MTGFNKERLIFGLFLLVVIVAIELILHRWHLSGWPVFMVMIFFFEMHMDKKRAHHIIIGGLVGIACYLGTVKFVELTAPWLGIETARIAFICLAVYAIVAFGEMLPAVFNNYAFMYFLITGLAASTGPAQPLLWAGQIIIGGGLVIGSILLIGIIMAKISGKPTTNIEHSNA
ncbi:hypothetical protein [Halioxenophilus sp. WMMB6]|uniref:hypothetical protein n=1 Tax=Halioxenophilus sp. WMMB6 TaxID=3073815 RepID=UPI00295E5DAB|nr:hypothetical protein [Halioxenophilus sp. WMMB6]